MRRVPIQYTKSIHVEDSLFLVPIWCVEEITEEEAIACSIKKSSDGHFYFGYFKYQLMNLLNLIPGLQLTNINVLNQNNIAKLLRWNYHYSNLHRKTIINSHKLTSTKKLLSSGFFDSKIMDSNLWFSDTYSRVAKSKNLTKSISAHYKLMYKLNEPNNIISSKYTNLLLNSATSGNVMNKFNSLSFYEFSFFYFIKRSHFFLNLGVTNFTSTFKLNNNIQQHLLNSSLKFSNLHSNLVNESSRSFLLTSGFTNAFHRPVDNVISKNSRNTFAAFKDITPVTYDFDFLSNDQLEPLMNITKTLSNNASKIIFFWKHNKRVEYYFNWNRFWS